MTVFDLVTLFAYNVWANDRTFESVEALSDEQFARVVGGSFPTIRETAAHVVSAEWIWLERWRGVSPATSPVWAHAPAAPALRVELRKVEAGQAAFLATLGDADLDRVVPFRRLNGEEDSLALRQQLQHVVNHSTYHRGQIATMIRQVGGTPISTDLLRFRPQ